VTALPRRGHDPRNGGAAIADPALLALARKYRAMAGIRRAGSTPRSELRALAAEFPGALRELDNLPLDVIDARADALESGRSEPWMAPLARCHGLLRAALWLKRHRGDLAGASQRAGFPVDEGFERSLLAAPRAVAVVFARLSAELGQPAPELERLLFPPHPSGRI
jgi:hypothetical protein